MSRLVPSLAAAFASGRMLCCAASISLTTDAAFCVFIFNMLPATASCVRPAWAPSAAVTRLKSVVRRTIERET